MADTPKPIILYDGVCGFCNRMVQFVLKRDSQDVFRFATLQSEFARKLLEKHGHSAEKLESVYLILDCGLPTERVLASSTASIGILRELSLFWRGLAELFSVVPRVLRDGGYDLVARHRYRIFGKYDSCPLPSPAHRHKFFDIG